MGRAGEGRRPVSRAVEVGVGSDRVDHAVGGDVGDAVELEQPLALERVEVRGALEQPGLVEALDPDRPDGVDVLIKGKRLVR